MKRDLELISKILIKVEDNFSYSNSIETIKEK